MVQKRQAEIREERIKKLNQLVKKGINPYPARAERSHTLQEAIDGFDQLSQSQEEITVVGRLRLLRIHGRITFAQLADSSARLQLCFKKDQLAEEKYQLFLDNFDLGDFIQAKGILFQTQRGEKTLLVKDYAMLAKSLLPLPDKWRGLKDVEKRLRKRYLDILFNPQVVELIKRKARFWQAVRSFLRAKGFLEVETPVLETTPGGADARPFVTHHQALDLDVYLRISTGELWQKRLMVAGFEKTFEIGRQFRNEGMDEDHLQDYTQMEFYWAYADYRQGMELVKEMFREVAEKTFGTLKFKTRGFEVNLSSEWPEYDYQQTVKEFTGLNVLKLSLEEAEAKLKELGIDYQKEGFNLTRAIDNIWKYCRRQIAGPGFLINVPVIVSPLAKKHPQNPQLAQRFQVIVAGTELGNGYSELNNPLEQAQRFKEQQGLRAAGDQEAQRYDQDFIEALEYGMPPTCGFGMSERVFSVLSNKSMRECQIFPLIKPED